MKRYIIVLPDGREVAFFGDERAALVMARAYGGKLKEDEPPAAPAEPPEAQSEEEESSKTRRKR